MDLKLKNIKVNNKLSEETYCYSASLYLDGKKVAELSNHGQGSPDDQHFNDKEIANKVYSYFKSLPTVRKYDIDFDQTLEGWTCSRINDYLQLKDIKKMFRNKVVFLKENEDSFYSFTYPKGMDRDEFFKYVQKKEPDHIYLNKRDDEEILSIVNAIN